MGCVCGGGGVDGGGAPVGNGEGPHAPLRQGLRPVAVRHVPVRPGPLFSDRLFPDVAKGDCLGGEGILFLYNIMVYYVDIYYYYILSAWGGEGGAGKGEEEAGGGGGGVVGIHVRRGDKLLGIDGFQGISLFCIKSPLCRALL